MGLFQKNYDKPGKGVSKNEPQKRGFFRFFELYFRSFWKLISAQFWYLLLCLPIVTNGLAQVGLAYVCRTAARDKHTFVTSDFFDAIKKNWKKALPLGIINTVIFAVLLADLYVLYIFWTQDIINKTWGAVVFAVTMFFYTAFSFAKFYQYTLMITFDFKLKTIFKNSWLFATLGIKHNIIIGIVLTLIYFAAFWVLAYMFKIGLPLVMLIGLFIFPSFRAFLIQYNVFPEVKKYIIDPYYEEHPDEDIEKRRELGLIDDDEDEAVFADTGSQNDEL
ncbi:MAG: YesL family protein [Clostridia bacterium]|nr:YesL family protein [Clostridia bacterium]